MGARDLVIALADAGIDVVVDGDRLVIQPASSLTDDLCAAIREAKPELLALLSGGNVHDAFIARRERLLRWGWPADDAEALAARLARHDRERDDDRVSCGDCTHLRPGTCLNFRRAGLQSPEVGRQLAAQLQRCAGFSPTVQHDHSEGGTTQ